MSSGSDKTEKPRPLRRRIVIEKADRFHRLALDPMGELARVRKRVEQRGLKLIDFTHLNSDIPLPRRGDLEDSASNHAAREEAESALSRKIADQFHKRRGIRLDPEQEILLLPHFPEGFRLLTLAFVNPGDVVLLPDPADSAYRTATILAGGWPVPFPLLASRRFHPVFDRIEPEASLRARVLFAGFPALPTLSWAERSNFEELVRLARRRNMVVAHDASFASSVADGEAPVGLLDHPEGKDVGIEFHLLAPLHDTGGWRPGYAVGNREILFAMKTVRATLGDPPVCDPASPLWRAAHVSREEMGVARETMKGRMKIAVTGLQELHWDVETPRSGFHLWVRVPHGYHSMNFSSLLLRKTGIAVVPGVAFGEFGHDYVLISLSREEQAVRIALDRLHRLAPARWRGWIRRRRERSG